MEPATSETVLRPQKFEVGSTVVYSTHGKCQIKGIEMRTIGDKPIEFYKLEVVKSTLSRSSKHEPSIWLPVEGAVERGLRAPINSEQAETVLQILGSREYYFPLNENWNVLIPQVEGVIAIEGAVGLAKAQSYLYVLTKKLVVLPSQAQKFEETVQRLLFRELSDALNEPMRMIEERVNKLLRHKLLPDQ